MEPDKKSLGIGKGTPGPGRGKGTPNKLTGELKTMILEALDQAGGVAYLVDKAESHPQAFMALVGKVLPMTVQGDKENPLTLVTRIELAPLVK